MESYLLYFMIGLAVFLVKLITRKRPGAIRMPIFILAGTGAGFIAGLIAGFPMPAADIPAFMGSIIGFFGGLILYWIDHRKWISRPGLAYVTTIVPGVVLAVLMYGLSYLYILITKIPVHSRITGVQMWALFLAVGFAIGLGLTFPERWFRQRGLYKEDE